MHKVIAALILKKISGAQSIWRKMVCKPADFCCLPASDDNPGLHRCSCQLWSLGSVTFVMRYSLFTFLCFFCLFCFVSFLTCVRQVFQLILTRGDCLFDRISLHNLQYRIIGITTFRAGVSRYQLLDSLLCCSSLSFAIISGARSK